MAFVEKPRFPDVPNLPGVPQLPRESLPQTTLPDTPTVEAGQQIQIISLSITEPAQWGIFTYPVAEPFTADELRQFQEEDDEATRQLQIEESLAASMEGRETQEIPPVVSVRTRIAPPSVLVLEPTSISRMGYTQDYSLPTNPVQMGSFSNYNKTSTPYEVELRMVKSGSLAERAFFLDDLERISGSTALLRVVTPERTYQPVNITGFQIVREGEKGAYFFAEVDVRLVEIRQVTAQYSSTGDSNESSTENATDPSSLPTTNMGNLNSITPDSQTQIKVETVLVPLRETSNLYAN